LNLLFLVRTEMFGRTTWLLPTPAFEHLWGSGKSRRLHQSDLQVQSPHRKQEAASPHVVAFSTIWIPSACPYSPYTSRSISASACSIYRASTVRSCSVRTCGWR